MRAVRLCLVSVAFCVTNAALAAPNAPPTFADREAARALSKQGYARFEQGDCEGAIDAFRKAEEHIHAPLHGIFIARCQAKLGTLLAARASYERVLSEKLPDGAPAPFKEAQGVARTELDALLPRIPSLAISVSGAAAAKASVTVDGAPLAPESLGQPVPRDPGPHAVVASAPGIKTVERAVILKEGSDVERVAITLDPPPPPPSLLPPIAAFSAGGLALIAGGVTLGIGIGLSNADPGYADQAKTLQTVSVVTLVAGSLGVGAGITLLVLRPRRPPPSSASAGASAHAQRGVRATLGPASIGLQGSF